LNTIHLAIKFYYMKNFFSLIPILLVIFVSGQINAQCPTAITLCSQDSVDAFPSTYPGCRDLFALRINALNCDGKPNDIVNLDSLYPLESVVFLTLQSSSMIRDISGLSNVRKVYQANITAQKFWRTPLSLDTLNSLTVYFPNDTTYDLKLLSGIKFVSNEMYFHGNVSFTPQLQYITDGKINIGIVDNDISNKISNVIPKNMLETSISIDLNNTQNIDLDFGYKIDSIYSIGLTNSSNNDFSALKEIKKIEKFRITFSNDIEKLKGFKCEEIGTLNIGWCNAVIKIMEILPNLKKITDGVSFFYNKNLETIAALDNLELPSKIANPNEEDIIRGIYYISMFNNPKLNTCNSDYLCRAFKRFGDSIYVGNNLKDCNDELLQKECDLSSVGEADSDGPYKISPNPVTDILTISPPLPNGTLYRVINLLGNTMKSGEMYDCISLGELPSGHYIIMVDKPDIQQPPQVIKIVKL